MDLLVQHILAHCLVSSLCYIPSSTSGHQGSHHFAQMFRAIAFNMVCNYIVTLSRRQLGTDTLSRPYLFFQSERLRWPSFAAGSPNHQVLMLHSTHQVARHSTLFSIRRIGNITLRENYGFCGENLRARCTRYRCCLPLPYTIPVGFSRKGKWVSITMLQSQATQVSWRRIVSFHQETNGMIRPTGRDGI